MQLVRFCDLAVGCIPFANTAKSVGVHLYQTFSDRTSSPPPSSSFGEDLRVYVLTQGNTEVCLSSVPILGNFYAFSRLIHEVALTVLGQGDRIESSLEKIMEGSQGPMTEKHVQELFLYYVKRLVHAQKREEAKQFCKILQEKNPALFSQLKASLKEHIVQEEEVRPPLEEEKVPALETLFLEEKREEPILENSLTKETTLPLPDLCRGSSFTSEEDAVILALMYSVSTTPEIVDGAAERQEFEENLWHLVEMGGTPSPGPFKAS